VGTEAPAFELRDLSGERKSLTQLRGQPVLLIFFNPDCGFCREMLPKLAALETERGRSPSAAPTNGEINSELLHGSVPSESLRTGTVRAPQILILTTGGFEKNFQFFAKHKVGWPVLFQTNGEVADAYQANGTPSGYLINPEGKIASKLAMGADALLALATEPRSSRGNEAQTSFSQPSTPNSQPASNGNGDGRASRFGNRSLAGSRIKRDGLKAGTPAPDFRLPRLDGRGELALSELRGQRVLLVFSSPGCGPCDALAPALEAFHRKQLDRDRSPVAARRHTEGDGERGKHSELEPAADGDRPRSATIAVVMISKGEPKDNRSKVKEHGLTFPIVLQQQWEISRRYAMFATPVAYLIDERGIIAHDVAVGTDAILALLHQAIPDERSAVVSRSAQ
jgi:peroxiredoxin